MVFFRRALFVAILFSGGSAWAQDPGRLSRPGQPVPDVVASGNPDGRGRKISLMGFVVSSAYAAGAVGVCEPPSAVAIRDCVQSIIPSWSDLTKLPSAPPEEIAAIPIIWKDAYDKAAAMQASAPPIPCDQVLARAKALPMWAYCSAPWR